MITSDPTRPAAVRSDDSGARDAAADRDGARDAANRDSSRGDTRTRRAALAAVSGATVALGLAVHFRGGSAAADPAADALYAVLIYLFVALLRPRTHSVIVAAIALGFCVAIELFQLTGVPVMLSDITPLARLVFGTTFVPVDLLSYTAGVVVIASIDQAFRRNLRYGLDS
jgi:hypothetical protein